MTDFLPLGTRIKLNTSSDYPNEKATIVEQLSTTTFLAYIDSVRGVHSFYCSEFDIFVQPEVVRINDLQQLIDFKVNYKLRQDWHEPDEQNVTVEVRGTCFDNAGFWGGNTFGDNKEELYVVLKHDGEPVAMVNLATLFAWATGLKE